MCCSDNPGANRGCCPDTVANDHEYAPKGTLAERERDSYKALAERCKEALFEHRADLHNYSTRPCLTCTKSAHALGLLAPNLETHCPHPDAAMDRLKKYRAAIAAEALEEKP